MNILFLTDNFPPEVNAPATRTYEHAKEWVRKGSSVTVITGVPNFPSGKIARGYKNALWQREEVEGIVVVRIWSYIAPNKGFIRRTLDYISFGITSCIASLFFKADVIVATSPQFFVAIAGYGASLIKRKPWVFELRDLWPDSIKAVGAITNRKVLGILYKLEIFLYKKADAIVALTDSFKSNLVARGIDSKKIIVIPNGANLEHFTPKGKDNNILKELNLKEKFVVEYLGTHGMAHGLDFIIRAIERVNDESIHFLFVGDGAEKERIVRNAAERKMKNTTFHESIPKEKVPQYIDIADVVLVNLKKDDTFKTVIPSKIFEAAAMGKPILLGVDGEARMLIEKYNAGLFFNPEDEDDFRKKLKTMKEDSRLCKSFAEGGRRLAQEFDRKLLAQKMMECLKGLMQKSIQTNSHTTEKG